jgi:homoserine acetyltransferase
MPATYESASELAQALRRAAAAHGRHETQIGHSDPDWPDWYAAYMVREYASQRFKKLPDRVDAKDTVASHPAEPPHDPAGGRNTNLEFTLHYGAGGDLDAP